MQPAVKGATTKAKGKAPPPLTPAAQELSDSISASPAGLALMAATLAAAAAAAVELATPAEPDSSAESTRNVDARLVPKRVINYCLSNRVFLVLWFIWY